MLDGETNKAGAAISDGPVVCPPGFQGSHWTGQVPNNSRAKLRALFDVLGHGIARFPDGSMALVTPDALKIIPFHEGASA